MKKTDRQIREEVREIIEINSLSRSEFLKIISELMD